MSAYGEDLTGATFGTRVVVGPAPRGKHGRQRWIAACACGKETATDGPNLRRSASTGCKSCSGRVPRPLQRRRPFEAVFNTWTACAKHAVALTYEEYHAIASAGPDCHYCGAALKWVEFYSAGSKTRSNLDRKDNTKGYEPGNVIPCCQRCNYGKGDQFTYEEWAQIGALIASWSAPGEEAIDNFPRSVP